MVIRSSSAREIDRLVAQLRDGSPIEREAAIARLRVIGGRAVDRLADLARSTAPDGTRVAAVKALDGIDDSRARDLALALLADAVPAVAAAAAAALRTWLTADPRVLDAVTALALDRTGNASVRLAALDALSELPGGVIQPVLQQLGSDDPAIAARAAGVPVPAKMDDPNGMRDWLALRGADAPLSEIHDAIAAMRERERNEPSARRRQDWQAARGAAHHVLALRGSRVALYDLRETFDAAADPLPLDFLSAANRNGDASLLESLARAWAAAGREAWWRERLAEAARAIVTREKLTARHAPVKRVKAKYPGFLS